MAIPTSITKTPKAKKEPKEKVVKEPKAIKPVNEAKVTKDNPHGLSDESLALCASIGAKGEGAKAPEPVSSIFKGTALDPNKAEAKPVKEKKPRAPKAEVVGISTASTEKALAAQAKRYEAELKDLRKGQEADLKTLTKNQEVAIKNLQKEADVQVKAAQAAYNALLKQNELDAKALDKTVEAARKQATKDAAAEAKRIAAELNDATKAAFTKGKAEGLGEAETKSKTFYANGFAAAIKAAITAVKGL